MSVIGVYVIIPGPDQLCARMPPSATGRPGEAQLQEHVDQPAGLHHGVLQDVVDHGVRLLGWGEGLGRGATHTLQGSKQNGNERTDK